MYHKRNLSCYNLCIAKRRLIYAICLTQFDLIDSFAIIGHSLQLVYICRSLGRKMVRDNIKACTLINNFPTKIKKCQQKKRFFNIIRCPGRFLSRINLQLWSIFNVLHTDLLFDALFLKWENYHISLNDFLQ